MSKLRSLRINLVKVIFSGVLLLFSTLAFASTFTCDSAKIQITFERSVVYPDTVEAILGASLGKRSTILRYDGNVDFIGADCRKSKYGKSLIVFQAFCGGSGCKDLDNYGIIDPKDLRVLLVPNDFNRSLAAKILGYEVTPIQKPLSLSKAYDELFSK